MHDERATAVLSSLVESSLGPLTDDGRLKDTCQDEDEVEG